MASAVQELLVFLASPGDVTAERAAVREAERRINAAFENQRVRVRIVGWEQVAPEAGRPQELINPLVYKCDVFVGLLNRRWGSGTGVHSSGFEEEFAVAMERRTRGDSPAIGMFFAELSPEAVSDPGPQLQAVLAFQARVRAEWIALYKEYRGTDHLATEVFDFLIRHVIDLVAEAKGAWNSAVGAPTGNSTVPESTDDGQVASLSPQVRAEDDAASEVTRPSGGGPPQENGSGEAGRQIADALHTFADVFISAKPDSGAADLDRVTLVGSAFARDESQLGTHHVNRLYRRRSELELTNGEVWAWQRTHFADRRADRATRTVPMWGLFLPRTEDGRDLRDDLALMATNEDSQVSRGALEMLTEHRIRPTGLWPASSRDREQGARKINDGPSDSVVDESDTIIRAVSRWAHIFEQFPGVNVAANYMLTVACDGDLDLLDALTVDPAFTDESKPVVAAIAALLRGNPKPLAVLAPSGYAAGVDELVDRICASIPELDESEWVPLMESGNVKVARPAAVELVNRIALGKDDLPAYLKLNDHQVDAALARRAAEDDALCRDLLGILSESKDLDDKTVRTAKVLAATRGREALEELDRNEPYRQTAWEALTILDPVGMIGQAREVLDDEAEFLNQKTAPLAGEYEVIAEHLVSDSKRAACALLARMAAKSTPEERATDLDRAVAEFSRDDFWSRDTALSAIAALVVDASVDRVPVHLIDGYLVARHAAELLASPLAPRLTAVWQDSDVSNLQRAARIWYIEQPSRTDDELEEAAYDDDPEVRMVAVDVILRRWSWEQIANLLGRYDEAGRPYWYNVIAALDEHLYGYAAEIPAEPAPSRPDNR